MLPALQSALDGLPCLIVDDPQGLDHAGFPLIPRPPPVDPSPSFRVLSPLAAIEVELAHVLGVLQHEIDRVGAPGASDMMQVELFRDGLFANAIAEQREDSVHDGCFRWLRRDAVADRDRLTMRIGPARFMDWLRSIAIGSATRGIALQEPPVETALGGLSKIIQVQFVDQTFDRDTYFCRVISCIDAVCDGNDSDTGESEAFDDPVRVPDISGEAGELVDGNGVEGGRCGEGRPESFLKAIQEPNIGAGDGGVEELGHKLVSVRLGPASDNPVLILDGRIALVIGAVPAVEGNVHG